MDQYRLEEKKGEGTFSEVFMAQSLKNGRHYAIKCMKKKYETIEKVKKLKEIQALKLLTPH
jgi:renal tumor antigen